MSKVQKFSLVLALFTACCFVWATIAMDKGAQLLSLFELLTFSWIACITPKKK